MTMHLVRGMTSLNTKKRKSKSKLTLGKIARYEEQMRKHNKEMKRLGCPNLVMNIKEYIDYCHGNYKPKSKPVAVKTPWHESGVYRKEEQHVPSLNSGSSFAPCTKKEALQYTGKRRLVGIATMHKSNMVPIFADDDDKTGSKQATEIATMRRG
ncbi:MAG: hypothetical protein CMN00_01400 [Rickettsiales bacterium]|nr:hypothetical protein [Rickettsiales bacterium]|tara:strand:+ start:120 stop:581 length:462 start_codon:yes stop_codon:yes gene_type:complete